VHRGREPNSQRISPRSCAPGEDRNDRAKKYDVKKLLRSKELEIIIYEVVATVTMYREERTEHSGENMPFPASNTAVYLP
jgi:hypothetical protein